MDKVDLFPGRENKENSSVSRNEPGILYIEDYQYLGLLFQKVMARRGHTIDLAGTGREGISKFSQSNYDVVVLDYHLPDMTGLDIAQELLKINPKTDLVLVTGRGDEKIASDAIHLGVSEYLVKDDQNTFIEKLIFTSSYIQHLSCDQYYMYRPCSIP